MIEVVVELIVEGTLLLVQELIDDIFPLLCAASGRVLHSCPLPEHTLSVFCLFGNPLRSNIEALEISESPSVLGEDALEQLKELEPATAECHSPIHLEELRVLHHFLELMVSWLAYREGVGDEPLDKHGEELLHKLVGFFDFMSGVVNIAEQGVEGNEELSPHELSQLVG